MEDKEPIAIVGLSCRFPGEAENPQGFFEMLVRGESAWSELPKSRFDIDAYYHPSVDRDGTIATKSGFFLKQDVSKWDAGFFSTTAVEAAGMDPQQRILLEVTYEAFENAGMPMDAVAGTKTSCHIGAFISDYQSVSTWDICDMNPYQVTGVGMAMLSNRLSWFFDLRGPSMTVDTACSSGLVALHLGVQSLRTGEASMAVVGGSNLILEPGIMRGLSALHFLSPNGKCHSFDASANGYGRGEGMGVLILKPLNDALRDNDTIRGVIRGTGLNQDGKTPAITMPSSEAQAELIQSTYRQAGLDFDRTSYFEAHGTGTVVGDPTELKAIGLSVGAGRSTNNPLYVGSVKTNLGHLESAAGVAGLLKAIFSLEKGIIPGIVGLENINPRLKLKDWGLTLNKESVEWPTPGLRRVSVNCFGYGGANSHCILDDAKHYLEEHGLHGHHSTVGPETELGNTDSDSAVSIGTPPNLTIGHYKPSLKIPKLFGLSSPDQEGITRLARTYAKHFETWNCQVEGDNDSANLGQSPEATYVENLAYTLNERRTIFGWRSFVVTGSVEGFQNAIQKGLPKLPRAIRSPACAFVFTGQGSQYFKMGYELQLNPKFYQTLQAADDYLSSLGSSWSVIEEFNKAEDISKINDPELSQPLCTVLQVALVDLLNDWGVSPKAVVGHSSGEIAAAYSAGILTQEDAWKIAYFRGICSGSLQTKRPELSGAMMAVSLSEEDAHQYVSKIATGKVVIACVNSSCSVTVSGDKIAIEEIEQLFKENDIWCRKLKVNTAYHSHHMEVIADEYLESIKDIQPRATPSDISMFSSVTGEKIPPSELGPGYWVKNMLSPVLFSKATLALLASSDSKSRRKKASSVQSLVEIGPHGVLKGPLNHILTADQDGFGNSVTYTSALHRGKNAYEMLLECAGKLWAEGHVVNLNRVNCSDNSSNPGKLLTDLPPYPWNHEKSHWHEARANLFRKRLPAPRTDLLGRGTETFNTMNSEYRWSNFIKPQETPWILDHVIQGLVVLPGSTMISMALEACQQIVNHSKTVDGFEFRDINFTRALMFQSPDQKIEVSMEFKPHMLGTKDSNYVWHKFHLTSIAKDNIITEHGNGLVRINYAVSPSAIENGMEVAFEAMAHKEMYENISKSCIKDISSSLLYAELKRQGMQFGPLFRLLSDVQRGPDMGCATLTIPDTVAVMPKNFEYPLLLHPVVLDGFFQTVYSRTNHDLGLAAVISSIGSIYVSASLPNTPGTILKCYQTSKITSHRDTKATIIVSDSEFSKPLVIIKNEVSTTVASVGPANASGEDPSTKMLASRLVWKEDLGSFCHSTTQMPQLTAARKLHADVDKETLLEKSSQIYIRRAIRALEDSGSDLLPKVAWLSGNTGSVSMYSPAEEDLVLSQSAELSLIGKAIALFGSNLLRILDGTTDAHDLLRDHGLDPGTLKADAALNRQLNSMLTALFDIAGNTNPDLQILEIGNGCAPTTVSILKLLSSKKGSGPRYGHYTFAYFGQSHIESTKALLKEFANVDVQELQLTSDLTKQNWDGKGYDVVLVNTFLLTSGCVAVALQNAKQVLRPGGRLVIVTHSKLANWTTLIFGTIDEWWKHGPQRIHSEEADWSNILTEHGMLAPEIITTDPEIEGAHQMSIVVSALPKKPVQTTLPVVVLENTHALLATAILAEKIFEQLTLQGFDVSRATIASMPEPSEKIFISLVDLQTPLLNGISTTDFDSLKTLLLNSAGTLWLSRGGMANGVSFPHSYSTLGLFRTVRSESPHLRLFNLDLSPTTDLTSSPLASLILDIFNRSFSEEEDSVVEHEFAEEEGSIFVPRLVQDEALNSSLIEKKSEPTPEEQRLFQPGRPLKCVVGEIGLLDTLRFVEREEYNLPLSSDDVDVQILYTGLNFVDIMASLGYVQSTALGAEFTGVVTEVGSHVPEGTFQIGQAVVGANKHCLASNIRANWRTLQAVPESLAPEVAATCLIVFATAYFALYKNGNLKKDNTILVHYAAGGLGQAAVQLAQHRGAIVYCTVGSLDKKQLLMERYGIPENRIFNSRDMTFAKGVMRETNGRGVDMILNSTFGEMLRKSWNCLADFGVFIEVGKRDILANNFLEMGPFIRGCTFTAVNLAQYTEKCEPHRLVEYTEVVREVFQLLAEGHITPPYPLTVMSITEAEEALRILQSGKHAGKIALKMSPDDTVSVLPRKEAPLELDQTSTYLLAGGLGGIGRSLADLMVKHGAKHIAFMSRSGETSAESKAYLATIRGKGVQAIAYACDITKQEEVELKIAQCSAEMPKIKGFVNCAMNLKDSIFDNMSHSDWVAASASKIQGSWNMHETLKSHIASSIMLSSTSGIIGHPGQANYAAGNTFQNGLAHYRQKKGLKATSIDLGAVAGIGYLAENADTYEKYPHLLKMAIREDEIHHIFLAAVAGTIKKEPIPAQLTTGIIGGDVLRSIMPFAPWANDSKFILLRKADGQSDNSPRGDPTREAFAASESLIEAVGVVEAALVARLAKALEISSEDINIEQPLHAYGVDSLIAVEVRNWVMKELKSDISILDILSPLPIHSLALKIGERSKILPAKLRITTSN